MKIAEDKKYTRISWILFGLSIFLILFSFVSPVFFTKCFPQWEFGKPGHIGDAMGSPMNPFIAIAGVAATFIAFLMQIQANTIQRTQFLKSLRKSYIDEKIDSYYKLQLLKIDIDNSIADINRRIDDVSHCITTLEANPFHTAELYQAILKQYDRVASLDRALIYKGFLFFFSKKDDQWIEQFNSLYTILDYIPEAFKTIYKMVNNYNNDIHLDKMNIRRRLLEIESDCTQFLKQKEREEGSNDKEYLLVKQFIDHWEEMNSKSAEEIDLAAVKEMLDVFCHNIYDYFNVEGYDQLRLLERKIEEVKVVFHSIYYKKEQIVDFMTQFKGRVCADDSNAVIAVLSHISDTLSTVIEDTPIEEIRSELYG